MRFHRDSFAFTLFLSALGAILPLSIDMGLPALPAIGTDLRVAAARAAWTLSIFIAGFAIVPILLGPLSDRIGRKPVLLAGATVFTVAGFICASAQSIETLLAARFLQGAGAGAGAVLILAVVRDLFQGPEARAKLAYIRVVQTIAPMVAPTLGVWVLAAGGWRMIYTTLALAGLLLALAIALGFTESRAPTAEKARPPIFLSYWQVFRHPVCRAYILTNAFTFAAMFAWITGSPLVMLEALRMRPEVYGLIFATAALGIMAGAFTTGRLSAAGVPPQRLLTSGLVASTISTSSLLAVSWTGFVSVATLLPPLLLTTFAAGIIAPNAAQAALEPLPALAGATAALLTFIQMAVASGASAVVAARFPANGVMAMTGVMAICSLAALVSYAFIRRASTSA